jgi:hypothetical protein
MKLNKILTFVVYFTVFMLIPLIGALAAIASLTDKGMDICFKLANKHPHKFKLTLFIFFALQITISCAIIYYLGS